MSDRTNAINDAYNRNQNGRTSFFYVKVSDLERLGITQFKSQVNDNFIRIMPPKNPKAFWALEVKVHQNIGANRAAFLCLQGMYGKPCPICEHIEKMKQDGINQETIKPLYARTRYLMFVFDVRDDSTIKKGLRWYDAPPKLVGEIINRSKDKRTREIIDVCDPIDGRDVEFIRKGTTVKTEYTGVELKVAEKVPEDWYANVPEFEDVLLVPTYEQIEAAVTGGIHQTADEEVEQSAPATSESTETEPSQPAQPQQEQKPASPSGRGPSTRGNSEPSNKTSTSSASQSVRDKIAEIKRSRAGGK